MFYNLLSSTLVISGHETLQLAYCVKKVNEQVEKIFEKIMNSRNGAAKSNETR